MATVIVKGWPEEVNGTCPKCGDTHVVAKSSKWLKWQECGICGLTLAKGETEAAKNFTATANSGQRNMPHHRDGDDPYEHGV